MINFLIAASGGNNDDLIEFDYSTNSNGFFNNVYDIQESGYRLRSSFAEVSFFTNADSVSVTWRSIGLSIPPRYINIYIDGVYFNLLTPIIEDELTTKTLNLPKGNKTILIRQGSDSGDPLQSPSITKISFSDVSIATKISQDRSGYRMVTASDSIGVGGQTTNNGLNGWQLLMRDRLPFMEFASIGGSGAKASLVQTNDTAQSVVEYLNGASYKILWYAMGANDIGTNPDTWETELANWIDLVHSLDSEINVVLQTMIWREGYETELDVLRQKERDVASTRDWCTVVEAQNWIPEDEYVLEVGGKVHPNDEGNVTYADNVEATLNVSEIVYSLQKYYNWDKSIIKISRSSDLEEKYVFFDGNTITLNSFISDDKNTPSLDTLGTWIGSDDGSVTEWNAQTSFNEIDDNLILKQGATQTNTYPTIISQGSIIYVGSNPAINFSDSSAIYSSGNKLLNYGKNSTITTVSSNTSNNATGTIISTLYYETTDNNRFCIYNDRLSTKRGSLVRARLVDFYSDTINQENVSDSKLITSVLTKNNLSTYLNNSFQSSLGYSGTYENQIFKIGTDKRNEFPLNGTIQEIRIYNKDETDNLTTIHSDINSIYSIY